MRKFHEQLRTIPERHHLALVGGDVDKIPAMQAIDKRRSTGRSLSPDSLIAGVLDTQTFLTLEHFDARCDSDPLRHAFSVASERMWKVGVRQPLSHW